MWTAIIVILVVFLFVLGGLMTLLKSKNFDIPEDYDPSKSSYDDDDDDNSSS